MRLCFYFCHLFLSLITCTIFIGGTITTISYPAEGYGIKYEGSFLGEKSESGWRKVRVVVYRCVFILFVSTTFGHNLHWIEPTNCVCDRSMV